MIAARIGRKAAPGEATVQLLREDSEVLEYMACMAFGNSSGLLGLDRVAAWKSLPAAERERWIDDTFNGSFEGGRAYDDSRPDETPPPDDGGEGMPLIRVA